MKAFTADPPTVDRFSRAEGDCQVHLPSLRCERCEREWRALGRIPPVNPSPWLETEVWYPAFGLRKGTPTDRFSKDVVVSLQEFKSLQAQVVGMETSRACLLPGSGIGPVRAKLPKRVTDFIWCGFRLLASRRALELLARAGIRLCCGPVIDAKGAASETHVAIQLDPVPLYSEQTLAERTLVFCGDCGNCWMQDVRAECRRPREFVAARCPDHLGLIKSREGFETIATPQFIATVESSKLSGIVFEEFGVFV